MSEPATAAESAPDGSSLRYAGPRRVATEAEARALASALRLRILRVCLDRALTNKQISEWVGRNPATVLHHVRTLVDTGFLVADGERRGTRGAREVPYRATGKSWWLDDMGDVPRDQDPILAAFLEEVAAVGQRNLSSSRLALGLADEDFEDFRNRLYGLLDEFARRPMVAGSRRWSVYVGLHPEQV